MAEKKIYPQGIMCFKKHDKAPDFVLGSMVISLSKFKEWVNSEGKDLLTEYKGDKQLRLQVLSGKDGPYVAVDTYKKQEAGQDLPF